MVEKTRDNVRALLLDIEGTTTPINFVFEVLFPFARDNAEVFLKERGGEPEVQDDLNLLRQEYEIDRAKGDAILEWTGTDAIAAVPYIHYLIATDRKSTALKSLQGKIWEQGYRNGTLRAQLFPDVKPAFERWLAAGKKLYIFSSGSVQAQQLLFRYSEIGNLTPFLSGYFDTRTGSKLESQSYKKIAEIIEIAPREILFISDVVSELQAARASGMKSRFSSRPGNYSTDPQGFTLIQTFEGI
ncbi:MAG: acireductone synthase [Roseofilum sp. SBFL]|uniref:acireductone synthase n=1 Tax=unclassified Roseofilum TaxID=2620099 RepID=UPI001B2805D1|nr:MULTISPECIES: acireductone synthase [unclassified Roseofilum]MBP0014953.1 acireductone synthase [Roseofilum sp. SID3]MBP0024651.1 acireductone synthase [Roseofilum sp. SID2]MBP0039856.1 acireductone synthase [Roseofilum sp. SID1]MBP0042476.1 acireductone synthase [Roseofilum sp. SBFL]